MECGNIYLTNNMNMTISNSKFLNNKSKSNGGAM